jgi:hypothetical protein
VKYAAYPGQLPLYPHRDLGRLSRRFHRGELLQFPSKGNRARTAKPATMYSVDPVLLDDNVLSLV